MKHTRTWLCAVLAFALTFSLFTPLSAASSSFSDLSAPQVTVDADALRLMGVIDGKNGNRFAPDDHLTRAEFATMAVSFIGQRGKVPLHATRTIFSDVTSRHWGAGAINLAASTRIGEGYYLISGVGDGRFLPDSNITYAQTVTILLRVLGYDDTQTGAIWPQGYLNLASSIGMTDGFNLSAGEPITRSQAARLFVNTMSCPTASGGTYYEYLSSQLGCTVVHNALILSTNIKADDGTSGAIATSSGVYKPAVSGINPTGLIGKRGTLLIKSNNEIAAFVPDASETVTIIVSAANAGYLIDRAGKKYTISPQTPVFSSNGKEQSTYQDAWADISPGMEVTLSFDGSKVSSVYYSTGNFTDGAILLSGKITSSSLQSLVGTATGYTIEKNSHKITLSDLREYDVVTFDSNRNVLVASELRLSCVPENVSPNTKNPFTITALGTTFHVLESAWEISDEIKIGKQMLLFLTADGKVAAIKSAGGNLRSNAFGIADGSSVDILLPAGGTLTLTGTQDIKPSLQQKLVSVSSSAQGELTAKLLTSGHAPGDFNLSQMTLGSLRVASGAHLYEQTYSGFITPISTAQIEADFIPDNKVAYYHLNNSGMVDCIVVNDITGDRYTYGILRKPIVSSDENILVTVENGGNDAMPAVDNVAATWFPFNDGDFGGVAVSDSNLYGMRATSLLVLSPIGTVSRNSFFEQNGTTFVRANGKIYEVSAQVVCYNASAFHWFTGENSLAKAKAYSENLTIYIDPIAEKVRIVTVK